MATTDWTNNVPLATPSTPNASASPEISASSKESVSDMWTRVSLTKQLVADLKQTGPEKALAQLDATIRAFPDVARFCHPVAHELGHAALAKYAGDFKKVSEFRSDVCGSGYLHGIVEEKLRKSNDPESDVIELCAPEQTNSCLHGIGHGAMFVSGLNIENAEELCSKFPSGRMVTSCSEGIFMQLFEPDESDPKAVAKLAKDKLSKDPLYPCPDQPMEFRSGCYYYAPVYFLQRNKFALGMTIMRATG
ncbi:hypothetical protein ABZ532_30870 [Streptomyces sp. NPDC019396]|uniref:hypothetical protein n=1 Tax=Streptomyces sp. NPDC019396 TaxID=3154687 RepID=UPI003411D8CE